MDQFQIGLALFSLLLGGGGVLFAWWMRRVWDEAHGVSKQPPEK